MSLIGRRNRRVGKVASITRAKEVMKRVHAALENNPDAAPSDCGIDSLCSPKQTPGQLICSARAAIDKHNRDLLKIARQRDHRMDDFYNAARAAHHLLVERLEGWTDEGAHGILNDLGITDSTALLKKWESFETKNFPTIPKLAREPRTRKISATNADVAGILDDALAIFDLDSSTDESADE